MLLAVPAAYALVRRQVRGRRAVYFFVVAVLLAPLVALAGPFGDQLRTFGVFGSRFVLVVPTLMITLPLAMWLCVTLMRDAPVVAARLRARRRRHPRPVVPRVRAAHGGAGAARRRAHHVHRRPATTPSSARRSRPATSRARSPPRCCWPPTSSSSRPPRSRPPGCSGWCRPSSCCSPCRAGPFDFWEGRTDDHDRGPQRQSRRPDGRRLLDDVSLSVPSGTRLAICGPPGAGKTALLRVLVGLDDHTDGDILIDGPSSTPSSPRQRDLAMVFSDFALHPHLDVYDNLAFAARLRRGRDDDEIDDRVEEVAEFLALEHLLDLQAVRARRQPAPAGRHRPLAGARRPRLPVRRAVHGAGRPRARRTSARSRRSGRPTASARRSSPRPTSHEALTLADRVAVMHQGYVHQVGTPRDLYERPADIFVAGFLGSPSMNLVPARRGRPASSSCRWPRCRSTTPQ